MGHAFWTGFGVVFAFLAVGGYVLLRWQSDRHRFQLVKLALERGIGLPSAGPPFWVDSLRAGVLTLALGVGLLLAGGAATAMAVRVPRPDEPGRPPTAAADEHPPAFEKGKGPPRRPPPPNPAREEWQRAQTQRSLGLASLAAGLVLSLLGAVRIGFAQYERKYSPTDSRWEPPRAGLGPASGAHPP
jgi:hypothetical protein